MLTLQKIKELSKLTNSSKVIKASLNLNDETIQYVERLYASDDYQSIPKESMDILAEAYINQRLINDKTCIEKLLASSSFKEKAETMTENELKEYVRLCDSYALHEILTSDSIIKNYSPNNHFELIKLYDEISKKNPIIMEFFKKAIENKLPVSYMKDLSKVMENNLNNENSSDIVILINSEEFYQLSLTTMIALFIKMNSLTQKDKRHLLAKVISKGYWHAADKWTFDELYEIILVITPYTQGLLEKKSTYEYSYDQISTIVGLINTNSHLFPLFTNDIIISHLTYDDTIELIDKYDLRYHRNFDKFTTALSQVIENGIEVSLYDDICDELDHEIYQSTISDYLDTCESIQEFIETLEGKYNDSDPINPSAMLTLNNPE